MALMGITFHRTNKMNLSWMVFGVVYSIGIFGVLGNAALKNRLNIPQGTSYFSPISIIILAIGIALSFVLLGAKGEQYVILGILFTVGVHFIPLNTIYTYILAMLVCLNAIAPLLFKKITIYQSISVDSIIKILMGLLLIFLA